MEKRGSVQLFTVDTSKSKLWLPRNTPSILPCFPNVCFTPPVSHTVVRMPAASLNIPDVKEAVFLTREDEHQPSSVERTEGRFRMNGTQEQTESF